jgi:hypothetical protein
MLELLLFLLGLTSGFSSSDYVQKPKPRPLPPPDPPEG